MKSRSLITFTLSLLLIASIGFMQYAIVTDNSAGVAFTHHATLKKAQQPNDMFSARDFNDDDDDEVALVKYSTQHFYNCDVFSALRFFMSSGRQESCAFSSLAAVPAKQSIYQQIHSYRI